MADFSYLKKLDVTNKVQECVLFRLDGKPTLLVKPATENNKPFYNAVLRKARKTQKAVAAGAIDVNLLSSNRDDDRQLYSELIITGWKGIIDASGKPVEFNQVNCLEFLHALPDYIFDEDVRQFCTNPANFTNQAGMDVEATAKN